MPEPEVIEAEVEEIVGNLPAVREPGSVTLFRTDDPGEVVQKATAVANVLSRVLRDKQLTTTISRREHVRVEGWTLLGTMLGVFPVVEWTRPVQDGWEARVEARTLDGAIVGAAEAECLRTESTWKTRDDYALRSMAQTRAVSKALRGPLGFVISLAGFEATPAEEMPTDGPESAAEPQKPFDPATDLLEGAIRGPEAAKSLQVAMRSIDPAVDWTHVVVQATEACFGKPRVQLEGEEAPQFWRRLSNAVARIGEALKEGDFPPPTAEQVQEAFAWAFNGAVVEVTYLEKGDE